MILQNFSGIYWRLRTSSKEIEWKIKCQSFSPFITKASTNPYPMPRAFAMCMGSCSSLSTPWRSQVGYRNPGCQVGTCTLFADCQLGLGVDDTGRQPRSHLPQALQDTSFSLLKFKGLLFLLFLFFFYLFLFSSHSLLLLSVIEDPGHSGAPACTVEFKACTEKELSQNMPQKTFKFSQCIHPHLWKDRPYYGLDMVSPKTHLWDNASRFGGEMIGL